MNDFLLLLFQLLSLDVLYRKDDEVKILAIKWAE